jgi:hypothetical protein
VLTLVNLPESKLYSFFSKLSISTLTNRLESPSRRSVVPKLDRLIENMIQVGFSLGNKGHQQYP